MQCFEQGAQGSGDPKRSPSMRRGGGEQAADFELKLRCSAGARRGHARTDTPNVPAVPAA